MDVFTYGTLMFPEVWEVVVGSSFATVVGTAAGFEIFRIRDAVFPGIIEDAGTNAVEGVVYLDVDSAAVARLDRFEDDFYVRRALTIECRDGRRRTAEAYVVPQANRHVLTDEPWNRESFVASGGLEDFMNRFAGFGRVAGDE
ncbi:MAG TPA: gamma-glutamylcyclotransferase family protein [Lacipirellulaceae bacterium]|nr:gamma-glutamylcyclotransferase family protein [Lacipirellulaceae bacterium]